MFSGEEEGGLLKGILGNVGTTCTALNINCLTEEHFAGCLSWLSVGQERRKKTVKVVERSKKKKKHLFGSFHRWTGWTGDRWWCHDRVWGEDILWGLSWTGWRSRLCEAHDCIKVPTTWTLCSFANNCILLFFKFYAAFQLFWKSTLYIKYYFVYT